MRVRHVKVIDGVGRPVAGAAVVMSGPPGNGPTRFLCRSAADGTFATRGLPFLCSVGARKRGYAPSVMRTFLVEGEPEYVLTLVLNQGGGSLVGAVHGPDG